MNKRFLVAVSCALLAIFCCCNVVLAANGKNQWKDRAKADHKIVSWVGEGSKDLALNIGRKFNGYTGGWLKREDVSWFLDSSVESLSSDREHLKGLSVPLDQSYKAAAVNLVAVYYDQAKKAATLTKTKKIDRSDILSLQQRNTYVYRAQERYLRSRLSFIRSFLPTVIAANSHGACADLVNYYRYQTNVINWQLEEIKCAEELNIILRDMAQGKIVTTAPLSAKVNLLINKCERTAASKESLSLKKNLLREFSSLNKVIESVQRCIKEKNNNAYSILGSDIAHLVDTTQDTEHDNIRILNDSIRAVKD